MSFQRRLPFIVAMAVLSFCPAVFGQWRLTVKPEEAFSDPKQVALAVAAKAGDVKGIERAVQAGANVTLIGHRNTTALWYALMAGEKKAFRRLLELGADPNSENEVGEPLVGQCCIFRDSDYLRLALAHGGNPNALDGTKKRSVFFSSLYEDSDEKMELMLKAGADINFRVGNGPTPIHTTPKKMLSLLRRGADPFIRDGAGCDIALYIFNPYITTKAEAYKSKERAEILNWIEAHGVKIDWSVIAKANVRNFGEASGKEIPRSLRGSKELNPEWVKAYPEEAERWYQAVLRRPAPKY